jgi:hypothetical protein
MGTFYRELGWADVVSDLGGAYFHYPYDDDWGATAAVANSIDEVVGASGGQQDYWNYSDTNKGSPVQVSPIMSASAYARQLRAEGRVSNPSSLYGGHSAQLGTLNGPGAVTGATLVWWMRLDQQCATRSTSFQSGDRPLFFTGDLVPSPATNTTLVLNQNTGGDLEFMIDAQIVAAGYMQTSGTVLGSSFAADGNTHMYAIVEDATADPSVLTMYQDGVSKASGNGVAGRRYHANHSFQNIHTGVYANPLDDGIIQVSYQSIMGFNSALSATDLLRLYNAGKL